MESCRMEEILAGTYRALVLAGPTAWAREQLQDHYLIAESVGDLVIVQDCFPVNVTLLSTRECHTEIAVNFTIGHIHTTGYLDPSDMVVRTSSVKIPCPSTSRYLVLSDQLYTRRALGWTKKTVRAIKLKTVGIHSRLLHPVAKWAYNETHISRLDVLRDLINSHEQERVYHENRRFREMPPKEQSIRSALGLGILGGWEQLTAIIHWLTVLGAFLGAIAFFRGGPTPPASRQSGGTGMVVFADSIHEPLRVRSRSE